MIKKYFTFSLLLFVFGITLIQAQDLKENGFPQAVLKSGVKKVQTNFKTYGTVLYSEDFDSTRNNGGLPSGWTVTNQAGNSNNWIWSNTAPGGQYSASAGPLQSTTGANGFLQLPADLYNTPFPGMPVSMDVNVASPPITIPATASVGIRFEHSFMYCCRSGDDYVLEVSSNGFNWVAFDITKGRGANVMSPNPEVIEFNVSAALANQTTAYVRFRVTGPSHYYFMIDDLQIIESFSDAMVLEDFDVQFFNGKYSINPTFKMIPKSILDSMDFILNTRNNGSVTQQGVRGQVEVFYDSLKNGQVGSGLLNTIVSNLGIPVPFNQADTFSVGPYIYQNNTTGYYRAKLKVLSNATNQLPSAAEGEFNFEITDSIMSKAGYENGFVGDAGPGNYVGGGNDGDRWVSMHSIGNSPATLKSVSIYVANVPTNLGATIEAKVWNWDDTAPTIAGAINPLLGISNNTVPITSAMLGSWITMPLTSSIVLAPNSQVVVGWEQISGQSIGAAFTAGRDPEAERFQPVVSNFVYVNDASPAWGWITQLAAIRLNFDFLVGVEKREINLIEFSAYPNPSSGHFVLQFKSRATKYYTLKLRNNLGQVVLNEQVLISGSVVKSINLSQYDSGVYILSIENEEERFVEKIIFK